MNFTDIVPVLFFMTAVICFMVYRVLMFRNQRKLKKLGLLEE